MDLILNLILAFFVAQLIKEATIAIPVKPKVAPAAEDRPVHKVKRGHKRKIIKN